MTQREFFTAIINGSATAKNGEVIKVLDNGIFTDSAIKFAKERIAALDKANENRKSGTSKSATAAKELRDTIFNGMEIGRTYTAKEIAEVFNLKSTQQATGLLMKIEGLTVADFSPTGKKKDTVKGYTRTV